MSKKLIAAAIMLAAGIAGSAARAADSQIDCYNAEAVINTGIDGTSERLAVYCAGGATYHGTSTAIPNITYFDLRLTNINQIASAIATIQLVHGWAELHPSTPLWISGDLGNLSGQAWGCANANCRLLDYVTGQ
jgi:hypothetical protein